MHGALGTIDRAIENGVDNGACGLDGNAITTAVPAGIDQVGVTAELIHLTIQHFGVTSRVQRQEGFAETGGKCWCWLGNAAFSAG